MISDLLLLEFEEEVKKTRAMLERVPMKEDFKPHAKSMPLGKLAPHVAELAGFGLHDPDDSRVGLQQCSANQAGIRIAAATGQGF